MSKDEKIFTFRVSSTILDYLKERADRNSRSIAKELEFIVKQLYLQESKELELLLKNVITAYKNEKNKDVDLQLLIEDKDADTPLKSAALELLDFVKNI